MKNPPPNLFQQFKEFKHSKGDMRKIRLIEVIIAEIAERGLHELNSISIAKRAKMIRSHVVYYFPNFQSMIRAAIEFVVATGQEITVAHLAVANSPKEKIEAWVEATFTWFQRYPHHASVMLLLHYLSSCDKQFRELNTKIQTLGRERMAAILLAGQKKQNTKLAQDYAFRIRLAIVGILSEVFSGPKDFDYEKEKQNAKKIILQMAESFWHCK